MPPSTSRAEFEFKLDLDDVDKQFKDREKKKKLRAKERAQKLKDDEDAAKKKEQEEKEARIKLKADLATLKNDTANRTTFGSGMIGASGMNISKTIQPQVSESSKPVTPAKPTAPMDIFAMLKKSQAKVKAAAVGKAAPGGPSATRGTLPTVSHALIRKVPSKSPIVGVGAKASAKPSPFELLRDIMQTNVKKRQDLKSRDYERKVKIIHDAERAKKDQALAITDQEVLKKIFDASASQKLKARARSFKKKKKSVPKVDMDEHKLDAEREMREQIEAMGKKMDFVTDDEILKQLLQNVKDGVELHEQVREKYGLKFLNNRKTYQE